MSATRGSAAESSMDLFQNDRSSLADLSMDELQTHLRNA